MSDPRSPPKNPKVVAAMRDVRKAAKALPTAEEWRKALARARQPKRRRVLDGEGT